LTDYLTEQVDQVMLGDVELPGCSFRRVADLL
jgi:hypothetical protein